MQVKLHGCPNSQEPVASYIFPITNLTCGCKYIIVLILRHFRQLIVQGRKCIYPCFAWEGEHLPPTPSPCSCGAAASAVPPSTWLLRPCLTFARRLHSYPKGVWLLGGIDNYSKLAMARFISKRISLPYAWVAFVSLDCLITFIHPKLKLQPLLALLHNVTQVNYPFVFS